MTDVFQRGDGTKEAAVLNCTHVHFLHKDLVKLLILKAEGELSKSFIQEWFWLFDSARMNGKGVVWDKRKLSLWGEGRIVYLSIY